MMGELQKNARINAVNSPEEEARAATYLLLGSLLGRPADSEMLRSLEQIEQIGPADPQTPTPLQRAWSSLAQAVCEAVPEKIEREYHALFIGVGRGELVPYASKYLTGFLMERPLAELRHDLARLGLARAAGTAEPEDHAAALCEVMAVLIQAGVDQREAQERFFRQYVAPWMPVFFKDLENALTGGFYRAVGELGTRFLEVELRYMQMRA